MRSDNVCQIHLFSWWRKDTRWMVWERIYLPVRIVQRSIQCAFQLTLELLSWHSPQIFDYWATVWTSKFSEPAGRKESSLHLEHLFTFLGQFFYIEPFTLILLLYCFSSFLSFISGVSQRISSLYFHFYTLWCMHFFFFFSYRLFESPFVKLSILRKWCQYQRCLTY